MPATTPQTPPTLDQIISSNQSAGHKDASGVTVIKYHLAAEGETAIGDDVRAGGTTTQYVSKGWDDDAAGMIRSALGAYASVLNIRFEETSNADADFRFVRAPILNDPGATTYALMGFPNGTASAGTAVFNDELIAFWGLPGAFAPGGAIYEMVLHEVGHGLGLEHTHSNGPSDATYFPGATGPYELGTAGLNQRVYSVMSYNGGYMGDGAAVGPMAVDLAALGAKYGLRAGVEAGDTVHMLVNDSEKWQAIYDTGGTDTIRYDGVRDVTIDLREATLLQSEGGGGYLSRIMAGEGGLTIAKGTVIEQAFGGGGDDVLIGNAANNLFKTHGGDDRVDGGAGTDTVTYVDEAYAGITVTASFATDGPFTLNVEKLARDKDALVSIKRIVGSGLSDRFVMDDATLAALKDSRLATTPAVDLAGDDSFDGDVFDLSGLTGAYQFTQSADGLTLGVSGARLALTGVDRLVDGNAATSVSMKGLRSVSMGGGSIP